MAPAKAITLRGLRVHNLKNLDVEIPLHRLTVITGMSGAGKGSLVFDTLYAEAQRRYLQSFSTYTRQFLERFDRPEAEEISDLPPAIAIRGGAARSPRATIGTLSEISEDLRILFARFGKTICTTCGQPVVAYRTADVVSDLQASPAGTQLTIGFPALRAEENNQAEWIASLLEEGYFRIQVGTSVYRLGEQAIPLLSAQEPVWIILDRVEIGKAAPERLTDSVETAFRRGPGRLVVLSDGPPRIYDLRFYCPRCDRTYPTPEPRLFNPNDPLGACPVCLGTGRGEKAGDPCPACHGSRYNSDALAVRLGGLSIAEWETQALDNLPALLETIQQSLDPSAQTDIVLAQIQQRVRASLSVALGYLTLGQPEASLSGGEMKRIALANALASNLVHVLYLLDEPTSDQHPRDVATTLEGLLRLRDRGNTVVVIEHERAIIAAADHIIDLGPGAGEEGGEITYQGKPQGLEQSAEHPTSDFYTRRSFIETPVRRRKPSTFIQLTVPVANNLEEGKVDFPLEVLCVVAGVNGAGKRTLVQQVLYPVLSQIRKNKHADAGAAKPRGATVRGVGALGDVVMLEQEPFAHNVRSNAATYLKIFDEIRSLFAETVEARIRNFGPGYFSFNQSGGRCETCEGQGSLTIDMQFLADVVTPCPECHGRRYRAEILDIKVRSLSIAEVLGLTIREAFRFFRAQPKIEKKLKWLLDVGLEYIRLGQSLGTLSGGECQRLKLAAHLASSRKGGSLFLVLEPSTGLHPAEVASLLECFDRLLVAGHSLILVENDPDIIRSADYVIELGPEGGKQGGRVVATGTPEAIAQVQASPTGRILHALLEQEKAAP